MDTKAVPCAGWRCSRRAVGWGKLRLAPSHTPGRARGGAIERHSLVEEQRLDVAAEYHCKGWM